MLVVIVYDIADNKRRNKLAKYLEGYGRMPRLLRSKALIGKGSRGSRGGRGGLQG